MGDETKAMMIRVANGVLHGKSACLCEYARSRSPTLREYPKNGAPGAQVEYNRVGGGAKLLADDGTTVYSIPYDFFGSARRSKEFIATANRVRAESLTDSSS